MSEHDDNGQTAVSTEPANATDLAPAADNGNADVADTNAADADVSPAEAEDAGRDASSQRLVPVTEAIRYRKRAQAAEQELGAAKGRLQDLQVELEQARQTIDALDRRQRIDAMLADAEAVDLEVARLLTEAAVEVMDEPDVKLAIDELRRLKPYLFRRRADGGAASMPARQRGGGGHHADEAADRAASTGDRRDLLRYLRLRRTK